MTATLPNKPIIHLNLNSKIDAASGKDLLRKLQLFMRPGMLVSAEIDDDPKVDNTARLSFTDTVDECFLLPRFNFDYALREFNGGLMPNWEKCDIYYEELLTLYTLVMLMKPLTIVETSPGLGLSTLHMAEALRDSRKGGSIFSVGFSQTNLNVLQGAVNAYGFKEYITLVAQESTRFLQVWDRPVDMVLLRSATAEKDWSLIAPLVKPKGIVVYFGKMTLPLPGDGVWRRMEFPTPNHMQVFQLKGPRAELTTLEDEEISAQKKPTKKKVVSVFKPKQVKK